MRSQLMPLLMLSVVACTARKPDARATADSTAAVPTRVMAIDGFSTPESVIHDADQDVYFVTNINGNPSAKDGNGFISRVRPDGVIDSLHFVLGGRNGVTLNGPKGTAIIGDTLWVADIDALRGFDRHTGEPVATIEFGRRAAFLNDLAVGHDGHLYASETGIRIGSDGAMSPTGLDNVFRIGDGHRVEAIMVKAKAPNPNGITAWDGGLLIGSASTPDIYFWKEGVDSLAHIGKASGTVDGLEVLDDKRILASSWDDSTVAEVGSTPKPLITGVTSPADFGVDRKRHRILIPQFQADRVEIWQLP